MQFEIKKQTLKIVLIIFAPKPSIGQANSKLSWNFGFMRMFWTFIRCKLLPKLSFWYGP